MYKNIGVKLTPYAKKWEAILEKMQKKYEGDSKYGALPSGQEKWDADWKKEFDAIAKAEGWVK